MFMARRPHRKAFDDGVGVRRQDGDEVVDGFDFEREDVEPVGQSCCFRSNLAAHLREGQERGEVARRDCRGERKAETAVWVLWGRGGGAVHFDGARFGQNVCVDLVAEFGREMEDRGVLLVVHGVGHVARLCGVDVVVEGKQSE
jgi:hypothetical protein